MPPRGFRQQRQARPSGSDPTVSIASAASARTALSSQEEENITGEPEQEEQSINDDLKKLIETLKNKMGTGSNPSFQKQVPPSPKPRANWDRSMGKQWAPKPAYTVLSRVSNHEKVPNINKIQDITINALPHSFLYRPGADGIKIDKLNIQSGKQLGIG